jgi:phosphotriesterase-related protein
VIVGHTDSVPIPDYHLALVRQGSYVSFDSIGTVSRYDTDRAVDYVLELVRAGFGAQILLSQDVCLREHLQAAGGCGYAYMLNDFLPRLTAAGLDPEQVRSFVIDNPQNALTGTGSR